MGSARFLRGPGWGPPQPLTLRVGAVHGGLQQREHQQRPHDEQGQASSRAEPHCSEGRSDGLVGPRTGGGGGANETCPSAHPIALRVAFAAHTFPGATGTLSDQTGSERGCGPGAVVARRARVAGRGGAGGAGAGPGRGAGLAAPGLLPPPPRCGARANPECSSRFLSFPRWPFCSLG